MIRSTDLITLLRNLYPNKETIQLHEPYMSSCELRNIFDAICNNDIAQGPYIGKFEKALSDFTGAKYCIATTSGTASLHAVLLAAGCGSGDMVLTSPLTFVATANAISYTGAQVVFGDIDDSLGLSPESVETMVKQYDIRYCVPVHVYGNPCRIDRIKKICDKHGVILIEDSAESLGSWYRGKHTGTFGLAGIFSFNGNKIITTGQGGAVITDDKGLADKVRHLCTTAKAPHKYEYYHTEIGYNYRISNVAAALGVAQMSLLPDFLRNKREIYKSYLECFDETVKPIAKAKSNHWLNTVICSTDDDRNELLNVLIDNDIMARPSWKLMTELPMYQECKRDKLLNAKYYAKRLLNLPSGVNLWHI